MTGRRRKWEAEFLAALETTGNVSLAAEAAGISRQTVYDYQRRDPEFARRCLDAIYAAADHVLDELWRRAVHGTQVPVYYRGQVVGYKTRFNDSLLIYVHETLLQQGERTRQRAESLQSPAAAAAPPKPPVELVVTGGDGSDGSLRGLPTTKVPRAS